MKAYTPNAVQNATKRRRGSLEGDLRRPQTGTSKHPQNAATGQADATASCLEGVTTPADAKKRPRREVPDWFGCGRTITQDSWDRFLAARTFYYTGKHPTDGRWIAFPRWQAALANAQLCRLIRQGGDPLNAIYNGRRSQL